MFLSHRCLRNSRRRAPFLSILKKQDYSTLPATLRTSSDLDIGCYSVRHSAALRIMDHHLHVSGIIPHSVSVDDGSERVDYLHDWYCVGQAVTCYPRKQLLLESLNCFDTIKSHVWVSSVGSGSSVTFGNAITMKDSICLASASRVFARTKARKSAPFTDDERQKLIQHHSLSSNVPIDFVNHPLPELKRLTEPPHNQLQEEPILKVWIGPQHINFADHVDHAFLAETASHALFLSSFGNKTPAHNIVSHEKSLLPSTLSLNYRSPGMLGQVVHCFIHDNATFIYASGDNKRRDQHQLLLMAEMSKI